VILKREEIKEGLSCNLGERPRKDILKRGRLVYILASSFRFLDSYIAGLPFDGNTNSTSNFTVCIVEIASSLAKMAHLSIFLRKIRFPRVHRTYVSETSKIWLVPKSPVHNIFGWTANGQSANKNNSVYKHKSAKCHKNCKFFSPQVRYCKWNPQMQKQIRKICQIERYYNLI
jgi:hypothetical protein